MLCCFCCKSRNIEQNNSSENDKILDNKFMEELKVDLLVNGFVCGIIPKYIIKIIIHFYGSYNIHFESNILMENSIKKDFVEMLCTQLNIDIKLERIYSGINDGFYSQIFHTQCDNKGEMIYLIKNEHNYIFGGYSSILSGNNNNCSHSKDRNAFLYVIHPNVKIFELQDKNDEYAVLYYRDNLIAFGVGHDLLITDRCNVDFSQEQSTCIEFGSSYGLTDASQLVGGYKNHSAHFVVFDFEAFKILRQ